MECNQQQTVVSAVKTLYENFLEEKCESDLLIPDYFPAAEKVILCHATPNITNKEVVGDRLNLEGNCRFTVIYSGEDGSGVKALTETVTFQEGFPLKEAGKHPWTQAIVRVSGTSCRLLNSRKISTHATLSIALKVKDQQYTDTLEAIDCSDVEALFSPMQVYTILEHTADTAKVQGELEVPTDIREVLKTDGKVCIKDVKVLPGKAIVKGVLDLFVLYTPESDPCKVLATSTAIPFTQMLELQSEGDDAVMEAVASVQNLRADVETDESGNNRTISVTATILTEGELYVSQEHLLLQDAYSNRYPISVEKQELYVESIVDQGSMNETLRHEIEVDSDHVDVIQVTAFPLIQKITGQKNYLNFEGLLDVSMLIRDGDEHRSIDKALPFTVKKELNHLNGQMRCEVNPCVLGVDWSNNHEKVEIKTEISCSFSVFSKENHEVISEVSVDVDHPLEYDKHAPLVVYYGEKGERLWDIARKYATSVEAIKGLNELSRDTLEDKKLLLIAR